MKEKQYKIEVPVNRGYKSTKNFSRGSEVYFNFSFNNSEGRLILLSGIQDAKMEILKSGRGLDSKQRM